MTNITDRISKFQAAVADIPFIKEAADKGYKFNCYEFNETGDNEDCEDDDREFCLAIGPITDFRYITGITGQQRAALFEAAFKLAAATAVWRGHQNTEAEAIAMFSHLNCPTCGGSGHVGDTAAAADKSQ